MALVSRGLQCGVLAPGAGHSHVVIVADTYTRSLIAEHYLLEGIMRHLLGDWGEASTRQVAANQLAMLLDSPTFAVYNIAHRWRLSVISDVKRGYIEVRVL